MSHKRAASKPKDTGLYPCPTCRESWLHLGQQCGQCGRKCTEARVREAVADAFSRLGAQAAGEDRQARLDGLT